MPGVWWLDGSAPLTFLIQGTSAALERKMTPEPERPPMGDPAEWARDRLNASLWSVQRMILRKLFEKGPDAPRRIAIPSCHGSGKSFTAGIAAAAWIDSASYPGARKVVSTAPTGAQVANILWDGINDLHYRGGLPGKITGIQSEAPRWHIGQTLVGLGRKPQDLTNLDQARQAFQGMHAPEGVLFLIDEATGVPSWLWEAGLSLLTNASSRVLAIGNPDDPSCTFAEKCQPGSGWFVHHISAFDTPLFTGEPISDAAAAGLVSPEWVQDAEQDYGGKDNPLYISKVTGQFPDKSDTLVISPHLVKQAQLRELPGRERGAFGLDVARSPTGDWSALYRMRGGVARLVDKWRGLPITAKPHEDSTVARTYRHVSPTPAVPVVIDTDGLGAGALDGLRAMQDPEVRPAPFSMAGPARQPERFDSRRSEMWWMARETLHRGEWDLDDADEQLAAELLTPRWWIDARGRIHVETKKELAKRGVRSTDCADAVIMADAGAPIDLTPKGDLGARGHVPPKKTVGGVPTSLRVRPGETGRIKDRPM